MYAQCTQEVETFLSLIKTGLKTHLVLVSILALGVVPSCWGSLPPNVMRHTVEGIVCLPPLPLVSNLLGVPWGL